MDSEMQAPFWQIFFETLSSSPFFIKEPQITKVVKGAIMCLGKSKKCVISLVT